MRRFEEAEPLAVKGIASRQKLAEKYPDVLKYQVALGWARYDWGLVLYYMGREAEAAEHFRAGIEITSKVLESQSNNIRHNIHMVGMLVTCPAPQFREPDRAIRLATRVLQLASSPGAWAHLALAQVHARKFEEALASCEKARAKKGDVAHDQFVTVIEAIAEWHVRDKGEARRKFVQLTTEIEEATGESKWRSAVEWWLVRREVEELMSINSDSDDWTLWQVRGATCVELKQWDRAIENYSRAITLNPADGSLYIQRARAYRCSGKLEKALQDANAGLVRLPEHAGLLHERA